MNNQIEWLKQIDKVHIGKSVVCPNCGSINTNVSLFRFANGVGYGDMVCNTCGDTAHISRIKFPENTKASITDIP